MLSALVNKFTCPDCSTQAGLSIAPPLFITCASCGNTYQLDKDKNIVKDKLQKRNLLPINTITIGATGRFVNSPFKVIGHIRSINNNAISNEWLVMFDTGKLNWLIENGFSYFMFEADPIVMTPEAIKGKKAGNKMTIQKIEYTIVDLSKQIEFQMEGQIPEDCYNDQEYFKYECIDPVSGSLASLCIYDKQTVEAYKGIAVKLADLNVSTLTEFKDWI
ncbi:MAG: hypothetical protein JWP12_1377 [Bacteroidetes bacterium]|nr:hypothetical protein [Bacteroidota bacterium]